MQVFDLISEKSSWERTELFAPIHRHYAKYFHEETDPHSIQKKWKNLVSMDAALSLDPVRVARVKEIILETITLARSDFALDDLTIYLAPLSSAANVFLESLNGITGYAYESAILLSVNPIGQDWEASLRRILLHECNHVARYPYSRHHERFLDWVVAEGLAELYVSERLPFIQPSPWVATVQSVEIKKYFPQMKTFWTQTPLPSDAFDWMYGSDQIPRWLGYAIGHRIALAYRKTYPGVQWSELIQTDSFAFAQCEI